MQIKRKSVSDAFDLIGRKFVPDQKAMAGFIDACFEEREIRDRVVLDAGCGTGVASIYFAKNRAREVFGIDISRESIASAVRQSASGNLTNVKFKQAKLSDLSFDDGYFDIVFTVGVLPYIENVEKSMRELCRVLAPGGTILILSLKKTKWDAVFEVFRKSLTVIPSRHILFLSKILAMLLKPVSPLVLKRKEAKGGKTLQQTIIETFFIPVKLRKFDSEEITSYLKKEHITVDKLIPPVLSFCSPSTVFVIKGTKDR